MLMCYAIVVISIFLINYRWVSSQQIIYIFLLYIRIVLEFYHLDVNIKNILKNAGKYLLLRKYSRKITGEQTHTQGSHREIYKNKE